MSVSIPPDLMVSVSGVRGRVGKPLTPELVSAFAAAFGAYLWQDVGRESGARPRVVLGRDARTSGPMFARAVTAGLQSGGCDVVDIGLAPTPTTLRAVSHHRADGGIVVTASHNPVEWNALKFASRAGMFLEPEQMAGMRAILESGAIPRAGWDAIGEVSTDDLAIERHVQAVLGVPYVDVEALRQRRFRVVLDCCHGVGGAIMPSLLEALGCEVIGMGLETDGRFPREPEPIPENLADLERTVRETGADIGLAVDPDADRLALVSNTGRAIGEDLTLAFAVELVLRRADGGDVVANLSTSRILDDIVAEAGGRLHRAPVGEIHVARRMRDIGAAVGGEGNGGVILPDVHLTRDAAVAIVLTLQLLLETGLTVDELVARHRRYVIVKEKLDREGVALEAAYRTLEARMAAPAEDRQDGLRLEWPEQARWVHLRPSGTEPILRVIAEAPSEEGARELVAFARLALEEARSASAAPVARG